MLQKTRGVVFHSFRHSDSSVIAKIYTESQGLTTFIMKGFGSKKSKSKSGYLEPLTLLELDFSYKEKSNFQHISEFRPAVQFDSIPYDIIKQSIILFINEVLVKTIKEPQGDEELFSFIWNYIRKIDHAIDHVNDLHLVFLAKLTKFLGFTPDVLLYSEGQRLNLAEGSFSTTYMSDSIQMDQEETKIFIRMMEEEYDAGVNPAIRKSLIEKILRFYQYQIEGFSFPKSMEILSEVLR